MDTLFLRPSLHFTTLVDIHFFPFKLYPSNLHYTSLLSHLAQTHLNVLPLQFISHHHTSPQFTPLHYLHNIQYYSENTKVY